MQTEKLQDGISGNSAAVKSFIVGGPEVLLLLRFSGNSFFATWLFCTQCFFGA